MFAYIKGSIEIKTNNYVVLETKDGVGYKIYMSETSIENLGNIGDIVKVHTYYYVREDNISLYGFKTCEELRMFELLLSVSGIGAKSAITMLSSIEPSSLALAVVSNDTSKLVKIPGIGAKTAARIVLELKDKLKSEEAISKSDNKNKEYISNDNKIDEAISALQVLGYNKKDIERQIEKVNTQDISLEDLIKKLLTML